MRESSCRTSACSVTTISITGLISRRIVSSNTPWFFNGLRVQWFPTNKLKIEPWIINGWQSYAKFNGHPGFGGQILYRRKNGSRWSSTTTATARTHLGIPRPLAHPHRRQHRGPILQQSREHRASPRWPSLSPPMRAASTAAGVTCHGGKAGPKQAFLGWMLYNRIWFHKDLFALTLGGGR